MNEKPRLFVDMDGTLAEWRNIVISLEHIEECYKKDVIEQKLDRILYTPGYFRSLKPQMNVVAAIKKIIAEGEIETFILSCALPDKYGQSPEKDKDWWLDRYIPEIDKEHRIFVPNGENKNNYIPGGIRPTDALLDDYTKNLRNFSEVARAIKLENNINGRHGTWAGNRVSYIADTLAEDLSEIVINNKMIIHKDVPKDAKEIPEEEFLKQFEK